MTGSVTGGSRIKVLEQWTRGLVCPECEGEFKFKLALNRHLRGARGIRDPDKVGDKAKAQQNEGSSAAKEVEQYKTRP